MLCLTLALGRVALGAPFAERVPFTQPDGTQIVLWGQGDEFYAVFETLEGFTVLFNQQSQAYEYARLSADGAELVSTGVSFGRGNPWILGLQPHVRISPDAVKKQVAERVADWDQSMKISQRWSSLKTQRRLTEQSESSQGPQPLSPPSTTTTGQKLGLTLLIDFSDVPAMIPQADIFDFCNADNYTGYGNNGSVKQYYFDNSNGQLTYSNVVTIYIRAPKPYSYYNNTSVDNGTEGCALITAAIAAMKALPNYTTEILPTFSNLTVDASSRVVACNVFFAGANSGVWGKGLWPHTGSLSSAVDLGNGKKVYNYQLSNTGDWLILATFCHENGHLLCGFPDLYDYGYDSIGGAGVFCLMAYGGYSQNPAQICAYLKRAAGWATTVPLTTNSVLTASVSSSGADFNKFYRWVKPGTPSEYFLVENRENGGHDGNLYGAGILIWHVDEYGNRDNQSTNFNTIHANYELSLMQADNLWHFQNNINGGDANDPYYLGNSSTGYSNRFNDVTSPSARWWDGSASGIQFHHFSARDTTMTFGVGPETPVLQLDSATLTAESCMPPNGLVDRNETVTFTFALKNVGGGNTVALVATLLATNGVSAPSGPQTYGVVATNAPAVARTFTFTATGSCGATNTAVLQLQDGTTNLGTVAFSFSLGQTYPFTVLSQDFDSVAEPGLPTGWTTSSSGAQSDWVTSSAVSDTGLNSCFSPDALGVGLNELDSPAITLPNGPAQLSFRHSYVFVYGYEGGVLEVKIGSGSWTDILTAGGRFVSEGYTTTLDGHFGNPLAGRSAWTGNSGGYGNFISTVVILPPAASGQTIQLRWCCGTGGSFGTTGWYVDTVSVTGSTYVCCPEAIADLAISMTATPDAVTAGDSLTYSLSVTNMGLSTATNVMITDALPPGLTFVSATVSQGKWATNGGGQFTCALTNISAHGSATVSLLVSPNTAGTITHTVTVSSSTSDPNIGNNTATAVTIATPAPPAIIQQPQPHNVCPGASATFAVAVTGTEPLSFQWQANNVDLSEGGHFAGVTSSNLTVLDADRTVVADYRCVVSNQADSTNSSAAALTMNDPTPPTITGPADVTVGAGTGTCAATSVALGSPLTGDNCGVASVTNNGPLSYSLGTNLVTWTVTDTSGNTSSCLQRVIVLDHEAPRILWHMTNMAISAGASCQAAMPDLTSPNYLLAMDDCSSVTVTQSVAANTVLSLGTYEVVLGALDAAGNVAYCTNHVVVSGTLPSVLACAANKEVETGSAWSFDAPTAAEACGGTNVTVTLVDVVTNGLFPSVATATWIAVDAFRNTNTCSQRVTNAVLVPPNTLIFGSANWLPEVGVRLSLLGNITGSVAIQWSGEPTNPLSNWPILIRFSDFLGSTQYLDSEATNFGKRFYRAVTP